MATRVPLAFVSGRKSEFGASDTLASSYVGGLTAWGVAYAGTSGTLTSTAATATTNQIIMSGANSAPTWSTATYPTVTTSNQVLYSTATNTIGESANLTFNGSALAITGDCTVSGLVGFGGATVSTSILNMGGTNPLTGVTQIGINAAITGSSAATTQIVGVQAVASSAASAFTVATASSLRCIAPILGAGSTITRAITIRAGAPSSGTHNALFADATAFTGNWALNITSTNPSVLNGNLTLNTAGNKFLLKEGSNASMGTATLVAGTVTVSNTLVTANSRIFYNRSTPGGTLGHLSCTISAGTSITFDSSSLLDTSNITWHLIEPA